MKEIDKHGANKLRIQVIITNSPSTGTDIVKRLIEVDESIEDIYTHITVPPDNE